MGAYIFRRLLYSFAIFFGVVVLVFLLFNAMPGDAARLTMGQRSDLKSIENARKEMNLDKPIFKRFLLFLNDLSPIGMYNDEQVESRKGTQVLIQNQDRNLVLKWPYLGRSYRTKTEVTTVLGQALPGTLILAFSAMLFATVFGILLGVLAALKKDTWLDTSAIAASVAGISLPSFFSGLIVAYLFGFLLSQYTGLSMTGSLFTYDPFKGKQLSLQNLILPSLALGIRPLAIITQLTRSALLDVLNQDYILTALAKGLGYTKAVFKHALPNALNPVVTAVSGWLAELMVGSFFVEFIFGWKGIGKVTVDALDKFDFPIVMGSVLLTATIFIIVNLLTDLLYTRLDPRVKLQ